MRLLLRRMVVSSLPLCRLQQAFGRFRVTFADAINLRLEVAHFALLRQCQDAGDLLLHKRRVAKAQGEHAPTRLGAASAPDASAQRALRVLWAAVVWSAIEHRLLARLPAVALDSPTAQPEGPTNLRLGNPRCKTVVPATSAAIGESVGLTSSLIGGGCVLGSPVR